MSNIDYIKSYMIRLGIDVDDISLNKWDSTLKKLDSSFGSVSNNLEKSDKKISSSIKNKLALLSKSAIRLAGVFTTASIGIGKFMQSIANSDMETQKFARNLYLSTDRAKALQNTLNAMDLSMGDLQDVAYNPELLQRYKEFLSLAKSFKAPAGMKESFKDIRSIFAEFQKFNLIFNYFRERVVHFIYNTVKVPAQKFKDFLHTFNNKFAININKWAEKLGTLLGIVLRVGLRVGEALKNIAAFIARLWDRLSGFNKKFIAGFFLLNRLIKASPIWRMMTLLTGISLLYDDYKTFNENGISSEKLKPVWQFVNEQRDNPDSTFNMILKGIEKLIDIVNNLAELIKAIWQDFKASKLGKWAGLQEDSLEEKKDGETNSFTLKLGEKLGLWELKRPTKEENPEPIITPILWENPELMKTPIPLENNRLVPIINKQNSNKSKDRFKSEISSTEENNYDKSTINQTFNFNLNTDSLQNPQTFFEDFANIIRNNKSSMVGA